MRLVGVDTPEVSSTGSVDVCCMCGAITIAGIYEMKDPTKVYFIGGETFKEFEVEFGSIDED